MDENKNMFMTDQAVGAVMMALQKSLLEQSDIVPVLKEFKFRLSEEGLMVMNPGKFSFSLPRPYIVQDPMLGRVNVLVPVNV